MSLLSEAVSVLTREEQDARAKLVFGQVFTPEVIVRLMLALRRNHGRVLEPSAGNGAFSRHLPGCVAIELDARIAPTGARTMNFFALDPQERFDTIIGNPPYVRYRDISRETRQLLDMRRFDGRSNLFLFFIEKCVRHLTDGGELIFIVPREFIKLTAAARLNDWLYAEGGITHWIEMGDRKIFSDVVPNCAIFRFARGDFSRKTLCRKIDDADWEKREMSHFHGQIVFTHSTLAIPLADLFDVRVGGVSGADDIYNHPDGNLEFVCSHTARTGSTRRMLYNLRHPHLERHKEKLLARRIQKFDESNWWQWGRDYCKIPGPRIYVNAKTRNQLPFFTHPCKAYDGSILALFPKVKMDMRRAVHLLNHAVPWEELGFVVDGRYLFTQRTLQTLMLPGVFSELDMRT
ncbi:MAG: class I SAM-dependent methyltransferase [Zoogloeaceae bacterium]|nr:class I SAM-dependent methyltransferase [Zoogloeaceae bacterium]